MLHFSLSYSFLSIVHKYCDMWIMWYCYRNISIRVLGYLPQFRRG